MVIDNLFTDNTNVNEVMRMTFRTGYVNYQYQRIYKVQCTVLKS